jgi:hypothetical protein
VKRSKVGWGGLGGWVRPNLTFLINAMKGEDLDEHGSKKFMLKV